MQRRALRCWVHPDTGQLHVPSEAVFQRVLQAVPRARVEAMVLGWQDQMLGTVPATDAVVIDGKEVRGGNLMLVNAVAQPSQRVLGVEPVASKTNEIPTARTLIDRLDLTGRLVQLDGMHPRHQTVHPRGVPSAAPPRAIGPRRTISTAGWASASSPAH